MLKRMRRNDYGRNYNSCCIFDCNRSFHILCKDRAAGTCTYVVERLGGYKATWSVGVHLKMPILDRVARRVSLKEQVVDFEPQAVITKDNVTMQIDTIVISRLQ